MKNIRSHVMLLFTLATVQYEQYVAENIIILLFITRFLKFSADFLTSVLNCSSFCSRGDSEGDEVGAEFWAGLDSRIPIICKKQIIHWPMNILKKK